MFSVLCVCQSVGKGEGPHLTTTYDDIGQSQVTCDPQPPPPPTFLTLFTWVSTLVPTHMGTIGLA